MKNNIKEWLIESLMYVFFFAALTGYILNLIERQKIIERIEIHKKELEKLYNQK